MNKTKLINCASDSRRKHPLNDGLAGQGAQAGIEFIDAFEQIECESGTGKVDAKITLQVQRDTGAPQAAGGKAPVATLSAGGFQDAVFHQDLDEFGLNGTAAAQFRQGERRFLVDQLDGWCGWVFFIHGIRLPPLPLAG